MNILSIEPTPSPNVMKLNMDESLQAGVSRNFTKEKQENAPEYIQRLLAIEGIRGVFHVADFISIERHPKADWRDILQKLQQVFGQAGSIGSEEKEALASYGEVQVMVQMFKAIPTQVKLVSGSDEMRFAMPERFAKAIMKIQSAGQNYILERKWEEQGIRYGAFQEVGQEVVEELSAAYPEERVNQMVAVALGNDGEKQTEEEVLSIKEVSNLLEHPDWEKRFAALDRLNPTVEDIPILAKALKDSNSSVRRLATVYLGMIGKSEALPPLFLALKDPSASVRRTAGDALSDIGDPKAIGAMAEALSDPNKLVRWRAARFLYEVGDETALLALQAAQDDPEFEVSMQVKMAVERIERGEAAGGTVWQQMTRSYSKPDTDS